MSKKMNFIDWIAIVLLIIGGLNWGLGVFNFNLVESIFGFGFLRDLTYALVGLSAIYSFIRLFTR